MLLSLSDHVRMSGVRDTFEILDFISGHGVVLFKTPPGYLSSGTLFLRHGVLTYCVRFAGLIEARTNLLSTSEALS